MWHHIFRNLWNSRKRNVWILLELIVIAIVCTGHRTKRIKRYIE